MLFGKKKDASPAHGRILAPADGEIIPLDAVSDPVFRDRILGDGAAVIPKSGTILSPVAGVVSNIAETLHAFGITTPDGIEILIHVGINTVELKGAGFLCRVKEGDAVNAGDPLCDVDLSMIEREGYQTCTPVIITNMDAVKNVSVRTGKAAAGKDLMIGYDKK
ncbi:MAG: PTS glucose transporter subunit IIA [Synergistaceae bacterium]|jgi:glucose-specific phosphotransferase system IIA component|nr:PTS glucose transporter subunit IIA [Synergistaceae bacterium]